MPKPTAADVDKLAKWEEIDAQALSMILMNIVPNVQAGLKRQSAGLKEVANRDNSPGRIMDEPLTLSTLSRTHQSCGHMDPQIDLIPGLPIQPQQYMSVPTKKIFLLTENMTKNATSKHLEKNWSKG